MPVILVGLFDLSHGAAIVGLAMTYTFGLSDLITDFIQALARF
jgi:hypothetical protein